MDAVKPAGPAQAAVQQAAAAPIKPGTPVPIKPEPAAAPPPTPVAAPPAAAVSPKPAQPAKADDVDGPPTMMIMPAAPAQDSDVTMASAKAPRIRGIRLLGPGIPISLGLGTFIVGRAVGSDVRLDDRQASRSHARITIDEKEASVEDLQTVNGTLVNGKEVKTRQQLHHGDTVQFGASEFKVELT